jgi:multiple sugar transport system permease protein
MGIDLSSRSNRFGFRLTWWQLLGSLLIIFIALAPFYWVTVVSLTPPDALFVRGVQYFPPAPTLENYLTVFEVANFGRAYLNSIIVATLTTLLAISISVFAGYAFARFRFRGRHVLIISLLLVYMLPTIALMIPMLVIFRNLGLLNTFPGLILAESSSAVPFATWLLTNYFASLPRDLEEAAVIDGCSPVGAMLRIALPLAIPGVVGVGLFVFINSWNNFLFPFMFTSGESVRTLPVLLRGFIRGEVGVYWGQVMAGAVMTTLPIAAAFLFFQRYLIRGMAAGAVKG